MARPAGQSQVDLGAMLNRLSTGDKLIGVSLMLLFIDSLIGSWFHYSPDGRDGSEVGSITYGTLWSGIGIVAALLLIVAIVFFIVRVFLAAQVLLPTLRLPDWQLWVVFGIVQLVVIALHWVIGRGNYNGFDISDAPGSRRPGWAWYVGLILCLAIIIGGYLKRNEPAPAVAGSSGVGGGYGTYGGVLPAQPGDGPPQYSAPPPPPPGPPPAYPSREPPASPPPPPGAPSPPQA